VMTNIIFWFFKLCTSSKKLKWEGTHHSFCFSSSTHQQKGWNARASIIFLVLQPLNMI
jgi:hypothetical protein